MNAINDLSNSELGLMFHTLGYDFNPRWNDTRGGFRNHFCTHENTSDYPIIQGLIKKGYMVDNGCEPGFIGGGNYYSCTDKAKSVVVDLWQQKKKENKPSRGKRRYQAYLSISDWFDGGFGEFLKWVTITKQDLDRAEYDYEFAKDIKRIQNFKKEWNI